MKLILMFALMFSWGCATTPTASDVPIFEEPNPIENEALTVSQASSERVEIVFNQAFFQSEGIGGFHVSWNGVYQGVFLISDTLDLPTGNGLYLALGYINDEGMRTGKTVVHDFEGMK
jgi:hypothetical protein